MKYLIYGIIMWELGYFVGIAFPRSELSELEKKLIVAFGILSLIVVTISISLLLVGMIMQF